MALGVLRAGLLALWEYVGAHVLTCLVPAFLMAGAMVSLVSREAIISRLGAAAGSFRSFSLAAVGSFFVAACSCTVIPVASGLYYSGAGIGPAFIVLWVAPAANVLGLAYTGSILGGSMALWRLVAAFSTALLVGAVMTWAFRRSEGAPAHRTASRGDRPAGLSEGERRDPALVDRGSGVLLALLALSLLLPNYVVQSGPYLRKVVVWGILTAACAAWAWRNLDAERRSRWLRESWWFVRLIFPLLLAGVFLVGVISALLPGSWVERWLGGSGLGACFFATLIGAVSYFATMTEAPFVARLISMGMGSGPALGLLLAGPGLSLPNMLAIGRVFGVRKAAVYVVTVVVLSTAWAYLAGNGPVRL